MGTEEGMDFGVSEHNNIQFGDLDDQFRREENGGDLLGISQQQINFAQPASFNPQASIGIEMELSGTLSDSHVMGPIQCSTPAPPVDGLQKALGKASLDSPMVDYNQPPSVKSDISTISEPVQETIIWRPVENSREGGCAIKIHKDTRRMLEDSKQQLCAGNVGPSRLRLLNNKCDSVALPALVEDTKIEVSGNKVNVPFVLPGNSKPFMELLEDHWDKQDAGLCFMQMTFQFVRTLAKIHSELKTGYGAFNDLECLYTQVQSFKRIRRAEEPQVFLLPALDELMESAKSLMRGSTDEEVAKCGRLKDIKALGRILQEILPSLETMKVHVSGAILSNIRRALKMCAEARSGDRLAAIAIALDCETKLCGLHLKLPNNDRPLDIVCYEGEKIHAVVNSWLEDTTHKHLSDFGLCLYYSSDSRCCVNRDQEVCHPFSDVFATQSHCY
jgi:hypothetical protein